MDYLKENIRLVIPLSGYIEYLIYDVSFSRQNICVKSFVVILWKDLCPSSTLIEYELKYQDIYEIEREWTT